MRGPFKEVRGYKLPSDQAARFPPGRHRVTLHFRDSDGADHPVGEEWTFNEVLFVPYNEEHLLIVTLNDKPDYYVIPLTSRDPNQANVIDSFPEYVIAIE